jgi:hypothetical protein
MFQSETDSFYIPGAVSLLEKNLDFGEDGKDLHDYFVSEKATDKLISIYNKKYNNKLSEASVSDYYGWIKSALSDATPEQKALVDGVFTKYGSENYSKFLGKINSLQYKLNDPQIKEEDAQSIQKELSKYTDFLSAYSLVASYHFEQLRKQAIDASKKSNFKNLEDTLLKLAPQKKE